LLLKLRREERDVSIYVLTPRWPRGSCGGGGGERNRRPFSFAVKVLGVRRVLLP
jgi:hypothetical protein